MRRAAYRTTQIPYVRIRLQGWLCVRCGEGRYVARACTSCGFTVPAFARLPRRLMQWSISRFPGDLNHETGRILDARWRMTGMKGEP